MKIFDVIELSSGEKGIVISKENNTYKVNVMKKNNKTEIKEIPINDIKKIIFTKNSTNNID